MNKERDLPETVPCQICGGDRGFHHLAVHLAKKHHVSVEEYRAEFNLNDNEPLFSRQYSESRREVQYREENLARFKAVGIPPRILRKQAIEEFKSQGLYTTSYAGELKGVGLRTVGQAIRDGRLDSGLVSLITVIETTNGLEVMRLPVSDISLISEDDLEKYNPTPGEGFYDFNSYRRHAIAGLANQGFYTIGEAVKATGLIRHSLHMATYREDENPGSGLVSSTACLVYPTKFRDKIQTLKMTGPNVRLIAHEDLMDYGLNSPSKAVRIKTAQTVWDSNQNEAKI